MGKKYHLIDRVVHGDSRRSIEIRLPWIIWASLKPVLSSCFVGLLCVDMFGNFPERQI
jgi:hypothetical protein